MTTSLARLTPGLLSIGLVLGCGSQDASKSSASPSSSEKGGASTAAPPVKSVASVASSAPPAPPPPPPSPADMEKKTWTFEGKTTPLVLTDLTKCFIKDVQLWLPEGAKLTATMESRGCVVRPAGEEGPYMIVLSDEIPFDMTPKDKLAPKTKRFFEETPDGFMAEPNDEKDPTYSRVERKIGARRLWCIGQPNKSKPAEEIARGFYKLCQTIEAVPPKK